MYMLRASLYPGHYVSAPSLPAIMCKHLLVNKLGMELGMEPAAFLMPSLLCPLSYFLIKALQNMRDAGVVGR